MIRYLLFWFTLLPTLLSSLGNDTQAKKVGDARLTPTEVKRVEQLHYGWYIQAVSSLLGAMGKELYRKMDKENRRAFVACLDSIEEEHDIKKGAHCLVKAFDGKLIAAYPEAMTAKQYDFVSKKVTTKHKVPKRLQFNISRFHKKRMRRNVLSLYTNDEAKVAAKLVDKLDSPWKIRSLPSAPALKDSNDPPSLVTKITDLLGGVVRLVKNKTREEQTNLHDSYKKLQQIFAPIRTPSRMTREVNLSLRIRGIVLEGQNSREVHKVTVEIDQPAPNKRECSASKPCLQEEQPGELQVPYAGYGPGKKHPSSEEESLRGPISKWIPNEQERLRSRYNPLKTYKGQELQYPLAAILPFDATEGSEGANEIVEDAFQISKNLLKTDLGKDILEISTVIEKSYLAVQKSFSHQQKKDLSRRKYTFLDKDQLHKLYGENGIYNNSLSKLQFDIDEYTRMSQEEKEDSLKETVRILAGQPSRRSKRALTVKVLRPTVLAPFAFAPNIEVFNILGPTVLSPNLFSPSILTPLLLSPPVLSPQIGHPLILSPYLLGPNVLSGSIFNPYILSPYVLSPNVLNPYVMSPLILSPLVLCPALSSPTLMSGSILSPSVASPAVLTESALAIAVLSPSVLQ